MADSPVRSEVLMAPAHETVRLASLDQFRGYTVLGMIVVNFIGGFAVIHSVFKHNDNYISYADTIMPSFHFAVGHAFRMTFQRRAAALGGSAAIWKAIKRSLALIAIAILFFGAGGGFQDWTQFESYPSTWPAGSVETETLVPTTAPLSSTFFAQWRVYLAHLFKSRMWNTFAIIGATQLVVLPLITKSPRVRLGAIGVLAAVHMLLTGWFNWGFIHGDPENWMVRLWRTGGDDVSWDGGFFGPLCWAIVMLGGTLAHDVISSSKTTIATGSRLFRWGCVVMLIAYTMSCLTRLYDVECGASSNPRRPGLAASPVIPDPKTLDKRSWSDWLAEPPFVAAPGTDVRLGNYWMMAKQIPTLSFILCATGFASALYGMFVFVSDVWRLEWGVFRTFGKNPLAAYVIHAIIGNQLGPMVPANSPMWYCMIWLAIYLVAVYICVRGLERSRIYIRL